MTRPVAALTAIRPYERACLRMLVRTLGRSAPGELRLFSNDELVGAIAWLSADLSPAADPPRA